MFSFLFFAADGPEISCGSHYSVLEHEVFTPNCTVVGYLPIETIWLKDEDLVEFPQTMQKTDAGTYTLRASYNNNIFANHILEIYVLCKCTTIVFFPPIRLCTNA